MYIFSLFLFVLQDILLVNLRAEPVVFVADGYDLVPYGPRHPDRLEDMVALGDVTPSSATDLEVQMRKEVIVIRSWNSIFGIFYDRIGYSASSWWGSKEYSALLLTLKVLNFWKFTNYCSLKPLWSGMGEVVPARTSPTLHPPSPSTVHQLSRLAFLRVNWGC